MESIQSVHWNIGQYGKLSRLMLDYLNQSPETKEFYNRFPSEESLIEQAKDKLKSYPEANRKILTESLKRQLSSLELFDLQKQNLEKLSLHNTVTITTGHQLNLFTGPIYIFYKILQVVKCCEQMNQRQTGFNFVPIFWMATEDHDFEEINNFHFQGKDFVWNHASGGAVGRMDLDGIQEVFNNFFELLPDAERATELKKLVDNSYLNSKTLAEANQKLIQQLFGKYGLLLIDGDDKELKKLMIPAFEEDLLKNTAFYKINATEKKLTEKHYQNQAYPREINLFYLGKGSIRERVIFETGKFKVLNSEVEFTKDELLEELRNCPEKFSPNVILRPLYQETVLPNIAYVGGAGESAYWLQLKDFFEAMKINFPLMVCRNSLLILNAKQYRKLKKLNINYHQLFKPLHEIININVIENSKVGIDFDKYEETLNQMFDELSEKSTETDVTFSKMVNAQRTKQLKGLDKMIKRFRRAERKKQSDRVDEVKTLYAELFPKGILQERILNFSEIQLEYGFGFMDEIFKEIKPIDFCFTIKTFSN